MDPGPLTLLPKTKIFAVDPAFVSRPLLGDGAIFIIGAIGTADVSVTMYHSPG
jgi:hypothetical protein